MLFPNYFADDALAVKLAQELEVEKGLGRNAAEDEAQGLEPRSPPSDFEVAGYLIH